MDPAFQRAWDFILLAALLVVIAGTCLELVAIARDAPGDTLSERVWAKMHGGHISRRVFMMIYLAVLAFSVWALAHFVSFGAV